MDSKFKRPEPEEEVDTTLVDPNNPWINSSHATLRRIAGIRDDISDERIDFLFDR